MKLPRQRWLLIFPIFFLVVLIGFVVWANTPLGPLPAAEQALVSDGEVLVEKKSTWLEFTPARITPTSGFILYPGGRVDYRSYAPIAKGLAARGYGVYLVAMPFNLAVFSPGRAMDIIQANQHIRTWAVGGHSLGGAMAANFVYQNPQAVKGLVLWASYPAESNNLKDVPIQVISVYGSEDGLASRIKIESSRTLLPENTRWVEISGGNHAQFGAYGEQPGDGRALISVEEQQGIIIEETARFLQQLSGEGK